MRKDYEESAAANGSEARQICVLDHPELDTALTHFGQQHCISLNGPLIVQRAHRLAERLGIIDLKLSRGWLDGSQN